MKQCKQANIKIHRTSRNRSLEGVSKAHWLFVLGLYWIYLSGELLLGASAIVTSMEMQQGDEEMVTILW